MRKFINLAAAFIVFIFSAAYGQEARRGVGGFMFGVNAASFEDLKDELTKKGFKELGARNTLFGGGGYGVVEGKFVLGGEGAGFSQDVSSDTLKATVKGGYGFFDVGYVIYSRGNLMIFPFLGIGGGGVELRIAERGATPTFGEVLEDPGREVVLSTGSILFQVGFGMDYLLPLKEDGGGLLLGLRAGYILAPTKADWRMADRDVLGGPDARLTGPYICLTFGGGGTAK